MFKARLVACLAALAAIAVLLPAAASARPDYRILVFTPRDGDAKATAGVKAIRDIGKANGFSVVASTDPTQFTSDRVHDASKSLPEYWKRTDRWYNFAANVRGKSHVLATVDENTYSGGTNGFDHPIMWCKDYRGGRSFYTAGGNTAASFGESAFRDHLAGAIAWTAGVSDPVYSDCGATVLANYQETKVAAPPNLDEPIGFDVLPDG